HGLAPFAHDTTGFAGSSGGNQRVGDAPVPGYVVSDLGGHRVARGQQRNQPSPTRVGNDWHRNGSFFGGVLSVRDERRDPWSDRRRSRRSRETRGGLPTHHRRGPRLHAA